MSWEGFPEEVGIEEPLGMAGTKNRLGRGKERLEGVWDVLL